MRAMRCRDDHMILRDSRWATLSLILAEMRTTRCLDDRMILRSSRIYSVTEYSTVQFLIFLFLSYFLIFLTKLFCFLWNYFLSSFLFFISYISKMKIKSSNVKIQTHDLCIWQIWVCEILIDWIYWTQKDSFIFDLRRNLFKECNDETEIKSEIEYLSLKKMHCLWLCNICSFSLSLWNMWYKFFTNKHDLIDESREELWNESLGRILADESRGEKIKNEKVENERVNESQERVQANYLDNDTETFLMSVQREFRAGE